MDATVNEPQSSATADNITTIYTEAAADSGDVIEYRPIGDARYWRCDDVTRWSDDEDSGSLGGDSDVTSVSSARGLVETGTGQASSSAKSVQISDLTNRSCEPTSQLVNAKSEGSSTTYKSQFPATSGRTASNAAVVQGLGTVQTDADASDAVAEVANASDAPRCSMEPSVDSVHTPVDDVAATNLATNTATSTSASANTDAGPLDEVDAVHPRLSQGTARRRSSYPAFVCDTCCRDTAGWQDCVDHAFRSGHGLAARCALCRLPAVRCRRRGRPGVWHRCVVVDTVRKLGVKNVAALVAGSHLTAPRPWKLSCDECGASFAAKTARLVRHVVERGHSVHRHCEKCLFPVFMFGLNDERREMHVCVGNTAWLRSDERALLATATDNDTAYRVHLNGGMTNEERGDRQEGSGNVSNHHPSHLTQDSPRTHPRLDHRHDHTDGSAAHREEEAASDYFQRLTALETANGNVSGHDHGHHDNGRAGGSRSGDGGLGDSNGAVSGSNGRLVPLAPAGTEHWLEERSSSCVAI